MNEFNWVSAREACSTFEVFRSLEAGVRGDVEVRQATVRAQKEPFGFKMGESSSPNRFTVLRLGNGDYSSAVDFTLEGGVIVARDASGGKAIEATVFLNDQRECRLLVDQIELEFWQFRRRALEKLFKF